MSIRRLIRAFLCLAMAVSAVGITACTTTNTSAEPEMLAGDTAVTHERHRTGIDSQTAD